MCNFFSKIQDKQGGLHNPELEIDGTHHTLAVTYLFFNFSAHFESVHERNRIRPSMYGLIKIFMICKNILSTSLYETLLCQVFVRKTH